MKLRLKIILCALLMVFAALSLGSVLAGLGLLPSPAAATNVDAAYVLKTWEGYVGVFCPPGADTPTTVTEIRVRDLPLSDRLALTAGVEASDYGQVVRLLEDYGS